MKLESNKWVVRKIVYGALAIIVAIVGAKGFITQDQADTIMNNVGNVFTVLAALGLSTASAKTHAGSDDKTTVQDVVQARKTASTVDGLASKLDRLAEALQGVVVSQSLGDDTARVNDTVTEPKGVIQPVTSYGSLYPQG
ncbi:hypothetical protein FRC0418_00674 [Corynebacterium diphtheriae]|nr:hypothetical protein CIP107527_00762 [Corynebacterium diphtheriae]CAB0896422.1 hypothetical protein FRC0418_00674 [Corynebacterium diphtheriae]CAB0927489.1 hypothetical protein FRC0432_00841 [Corynebacterium diphtheriae]CAB0943253.1 hypothetical protein FRC0448_00645 [Corynebacterium diphtheriae]CAB0970967.1 hypothetical protein FRC0470_02047 [Corynebacterium diphtheriae]